VKERIPIYEGDKRVAVDYEPVAPSTIKILLSRLRRIDL